MLDTDLHPQSPSQAKQPLDADRFYHGFLWELGEPGYYVGELCTGPKGHIYAIAGDLSIDPPRILMKSSGDGGRTWGESWLLKDKQGTPLNGFHFSMLRLPSGRLGLVYGDSHVKGCHPGRDGGRMASFRTSDDEGRTWSDRVSIDSRFGLCCTGHAMVLPSGRILAPAFRWVSPLPGNEAESWASDNWDNDQCGGPFSYSYTYYSDDEGKTWQMSRSELFVSVQRAAYDLEEPMAILLKDGRLLMYLRSQLGRIYRSFSKDEGVSWSPPQAVHIASSYCPQYLSRLPSGELLMVWNQVSRQEIMTGLHRHRLSCAISKDEGETWTNFKNLESLDNRAEITPPPKNLVQAVEQFESYGYHQPSDLERYPRAPGVLRICYPKVLLRDNEVIIIYDYGFGTLGKKTGLKIRIIPVEWFLT